MGFAPLQSGLVCSGTLCCFASDFVGSTSKYSIGALGGTDSGCGNYAVGFDCGKASLHWPAEVCGVFACETPDATCLNYRLPTGSLTGVRLEMVASEGTAVYPHVVAHGTSNEQILLQPGADLDFLHNGTRVLLSVNSTHPRTNAEVYGRRYQDDHLPYSCPSGDGEVTSGVESA